MRNHRTLFVHARGLTKESRVYLDSEGGGLRQRLDRALQWFDGASPSELETVSHATYASLLRDCGILKSLPDAKRLHSYLAIAKHETQTFVGNMVVHMYGNCGALGEAVAAFSCIAHRNVFSWNILLVANAQNGLLLEADELFSKMPERNVISWNTMIDACARNGRLQRAWNLFEATPERNFVSWNILVTANAQSGHFYDSLILFRKMILHGENPDNVTFITILDACGKLDDGAVVHKLAIDRGLERDTKVVNALISMYGRHQALASARQVFESANSANVVTWSAMVAAYAQNGHGIEALQCFLKMDLEGMRPNMITFVSIIDACAGIPSLRHGKAIHESIQGSEISINLGNALINMYGKCASVEQARLVFENMVSMDVVTWSAMVAAYSHNGYYVEALVTFRSMELDGLKPNAVSFTNILAACSHAGFLEDGCYYYHCATRDYQLPSNLDHCRIMVDLLGRAGKLEEAESFLRSRNLVSDEVAWTTHLSHCRSHNDHQRGHRAAKGGVKKDISSSYVILSNLVQK